MNSALRQNSTLPRVQKILDNSNMICSPIQLFRCLTNPHASAKYCFPISGVIIILMVSSPVKPVKAMSKAVPVETAEAVPAVETAEAVKGCYDVNVVHKVYCSCNGWSIP